MKTDVLLPLFTALILMTACTSDPGDDPVVEPPVGGGHTEHPFYVNNVLRDKMVIQQNKPFKIWGKGTTGETVTTSASWTNGVATTTVDADGFWSLAIDVPSAPAGNPPQSFTVGNGKVSFPVNNVLIGEVWFLSGQSNMQMEMERPAAGGHEGVIDYQTEIASADHPLLRFFSCNLAMNDTPQWESVGIWKICSPTTAGLLSAVGYYFGRELVLRLNIPVGLVITAYGGVSAQGYTSIETLNSSTLLKSKYVTPFLADPASMDPAYHPARTYNAMVHPFFPLSVRGILWYQGESNFWEPDVYHILEKYKLADWRKRFEQGDLPYYYVQMTPYAWGQADVPSAFYMDEYALFRECQSKIRAQNEKCEMAITMDIGNLVDPHPRQKKEVGERLARIALNKDYNMPDVNFRGPSYKSHINDGGVVKITFDYANGLNANDNQSPQHFYLAGADKKFYLATAEIHADQIWLTCPQVENPVSIRYAFLRFPMTNLQNSDGLPAEPFRTDVWPQVTYDQK